jgi:UDP-N-acetylmuramoyl-L-alanyl-D-glutamate--2,6-diaminopimelate ligase
MEEYFEAKASLFTTERARRAVVWTDDPYGARLAERTSLPVTPVSRSDAEEVVSSLRGSTFFWRGHLVNSPLVGAYNVDNALVALAIGATLGLDEAGLAHAMADVAAVPGRFEVVHGTGVTVVVDYAHTPEGLARLLSDVRALEPSARIVTVFGAGGDRDATKRPAMGAAAARGSDAVVLTSDNPRSESPDAIMDDVAAGIEGGAAVHREVDRRRAIAGAIASASPGDVVVIAGKGHETTQVIGASAVPFDDRAVAQEYLR